MTCLNQPINFKLAGVSILGAVVLAAGLAVATPPESIQLTGVVRDFHERTANPPGNQRAHPDFEVEPDAGFGHYCGNVALQLDDLGKPVFTGDGWKMSSQARDSDNRPICWALVDATLGDSAESRGVSDDGGIKNVRTFNRWYRDRPRWNMSQTLDLTFNLQPDGTYVFDDTVDPQYQSLGGFFPIENQLFGNSGGSPDRNFHFTFELHTEFTYQAGEGQFFRFVGDDDVWVFINGELVIDLGGIHSATEQFVDVDRLGLTDGEDYTLDFFFAERHRTQSNFRIVTSLHLDDPYTPSITAAFD